MNATRTLLPAEMAFGTVTVTDRADGFVETPEAFVQFVGEPAPFATRTFDVAILVGIKVLYGKVIVTVPEPAPNAFAAVKFTVSEEAALTPSGLTFTVTLVTGPTFEIV